MREKLVALSALLLLQCQAESPASDDAAGGVAGAGGLAVSGASGAAGSASAGGGVGGAGGAENVVGTTGGGGSSSAGADGSPSAGQGGGGGGGGAGSQCAPHVSADNRATVAAALDALFIDKDLSAIDRYWADPYLQHNPIAESGVAAFKNVMGSVVSSPSFSYERLRTLAECDLVVVYGRYSGTGVIFDLFRVEDGKLIEHWDSDAGQASDPGGTTENPPSPDIEANRAVVLAANEHANVHHVIADGSFVFTLSEGTEAGAAYAFYDLFRLQGAQVVEHWSSRRRVPSSTASGLGIF